MSRRVAPRIALVALTCLVFVVSSCGTTGQDPADGASPTTARPTTTIPEPKVEASIADGASDVPLTRPVGLTVEHGTLKSVDLTVASGPDFAPDPDKGSLNDTRTGWLSPADFAPGTTYRIAAEIHGENGETSEHFWNFTTGKAPTELHTSLNVGDGSTYGVGMPIIVTLDTPVPESERQAVTDRLKITSTPAVTGGWRWFSDTSVHYRPSDYWPAHTKVNLGIDFAGLHFAPGVWGVDGREVNFAIGDSHITLVDAAAHQMTVTVNGAAVKTIPVSTGRPGPETETRSGVHVVNEKSPLVVMDSSTIGIPVDSPDGYKIDAKWSVRISNSGEFVHSAPWSVGSQGRANVSHGCVNASPADAKWFFDLTMTGDVVQVVNTPRQLEPWNGYGDWQVPWDSWVN